MDQQPKFQFGMSTAAAGIAAVAIALGAARIHLGLAIMSVGFVSGLLSSFCSGRKHDVALSIALVLIVLGALVLSAPIVH